MVGVKEGRTKCGKRDENKRQTLKPSALHPTTRGEGGDLKEGSNGRELKARSN